MYYEINVSLNGQHFFATAKRSIQSERQLKEAAAIFKKKFPKSEGYELRCTYWKSMGNEVKL
jgi:hypothetical protein